MSTLLAVSACQEQAELKFEQNTTSENTIESYQLLTDNELIAQADHLVVYQNKGLALEDKQNNEFSLLTGQYGQTDYRFTNSGLRVVAEDKTRQQVMLSQYQPHDASWQAPVYLPKTEFKVEGVCLYQDPADNLFAFLVGEEGHGQQWLVADKTSLLNQPVLVREMNLPPASEYCQVNDQHAQMFINEENMGVWTYPASPEAELSRDAVALVSPFGKVKQSASGMALLEGQLLISDPAQGEILLYQQKEDNWQLINQFDISSFEDAENISVRLSDDTLQLAVIHNDGVALTSLDWQSVTTQKQQAVTTVQAAVESAPIPHKGDAADDPAIWVNPHNPEQSRVLGTDKKGGLAVYDLQGQQVQYLPVGRLNNVDLRSGFTFGNRIVDLAVATNRDNNSLDLFTIDTNTGWVSEAGQLKTESDKIYGLCMFKDDQNRFYAIANDKDGRFLQYEILAQNDTLSASLRRQFSVDSQPEGCVADDKTHTLFLGEEDVAVWRTDANPDTAADLTVVAKTGDKLTADIEGISLYHGKTTSYLVISSQGSNDYVVIESKPPYQYKGTFRIGLNAEDHIDGASETDGLTVTSVNLGGIWQQGMLVVQDGRNRLPAMNQNFKYVPWSRIANTLNLQD